MDDSSETPSKLDPRWEAPTTVAGFTGTAPNPVLLDFARRRLAEGRCEQVLDLGCGAGRNAIPIASLGCRVTGVDLSWPMLEAAVRQVPPNEDGPEVAWVMAPMHRLPFRDATFDLVIAHGIWNLSRSDAELRQAMAEAARVARDGAGLFVFTFSRHTLPAEATPVEGERYVYTQFSGQRQCFLTEAELVAELEAVGFILERPGPLTEYNRPSPGALALVSRAPVIYEGTFVRRGRGESRLS